MPADLTPRMPLALAFAGLDAALDLRACVGFARETGYRACAIDAMRHGVRPRELGRSARRELGATLRRNELSLTGIDLWIPSAHFADGANTDRAVAAVGAACELAHDLDALSRGTYGLSGAPGAPTGVGARVVSITLPEDPPSDVLDAIAAHADRSGVRIADHAWPAREGPGAERPIRCGVDPASLLLKGVDPAQAASALGARLASARLSDANDAGRVAPRTGLAGQVAARLDVEAYFVALLTAGYARPVVVDLRAVPEQRAAASAIAEYWAIGPDAT